ncbi:MAG TPA: ORF6N domain-containing protein [Pyrinomonadaceae bacterium]|jgi:ORF6N domain|nr:ORF6N domain-containing protein [Pyrinomonadaceae bacterium]
MPHKKNLTTTDLAISVQLVERRIYLIRGHKVMIDGDLAKLYGVATKALNQQVQRNRQRFPEDFMFQLTKEEAENLRSQIVTSRSSHGGRRSLPYAFTEPGVAMLSSVLNSERAIEVNITIMRAFIKLRQMMEANEDLNRKFAAVIRKLSTHDSYFKVVFAELRKLTEQPNPARKHIGFKPPDKT